MNIKERVLKQLAFLRKEAQENNYTQKEEQIKKQFELVMGIDCDTAAFFYDVGFAEGYEEGKGLK